MGTILNIIICTESFFIRIVRISIVGQSEAIIGEGVLIRDYRLTHITFETPLTYPDVQTSIKNFWSQKNKNFLDRPFNGRFFLWAFHFIFFLRELSFSQCIKLTFFNVKNGPDFSQVLFLEFSKILSAAQPILVMWSGSQSAIFELYLENLFILIFQLHIPKYSK